jgi:hypothetical protein
MWIIAIRLGEVIAASCSAHLCLLSFGLPGMSRGFWIFLFTLNNYFSYDNATSLAFYPPYQCSFPAKQTHLLSLWDELGIPHAHSKQEFGYVLCIIGFEVDVTAIVISIDHND